VPRIVLLAALLAFELACAASGYDPVTADPDADASQPASMEAFPLESHGAKLNAIIYLAEGAKLHPTAILLHGYPGNERNLDLAHAVRRAGWNVVFFHYRGAWGSEGDFSFSHAVADAEAAVEFVLSEEYPFRARSSPKRVALIGHSMGGFVALTAASREPRVGCVVSMAGANLGAMGRAASEEPARAEAVAGALGGWSGPIRGATGAALVEELVADPDAFDPTLRAPDLSTRSVLLVGGTRDVVTPVDVNHWPMLRALEKAGGSVEHVELPTDHAFSTRRIALAEEVVDFLGRRCN
jgi:pimeloyl-ACP methyl ester carboxylesterase